MTQNGREIAMGIDKYVTPNKVNNLLLTLCAYFLFSIHADFKEVKETVVKLNRDYAVIQMKLDALEQNINEIEHETYTQHYNSLHSDTTNYNR